MFWQECAIAKLLRPLVRGELPWNIASCPSQRSHFSFGWESLPKRICVPHRYKLSHRFRMRSEILGFLGYICNSHNSDGIQLLIRREKLLHGLAEIPQNTNFDSCGGELCSSSPLVPMVRNSNMMRRKNSELDAFVVVCLWCQIRNTGHANCIKLQVSKTYTYSA